MTVHELDTPFQLPRPDIEILKTSREDLQHQINTLSDIYLPVLREKLLDLKVELSTVDDSTLHALTVIAPLLVNDGLPDLLDAIVALRGQEVSDEVAEAIAGLTDELRVQIGEGLTRVRDHAQNLDNSLTNLRAASFREVRFLIEPLSQEATTLDDRLTAQQTRLDDLVTQESAVNKLIADVESITWIDRLLPLVKSLEKLAEIDPKNPLIGSIKAGLEGLKNILNLANDQIKYANLIDLRGNLQEQLDGLRSTLRDLKERRDDVGIKLKQLRGVEALDVPKGVYLEEIGKLLEALRRFLIGSVATTEEDIVAYASRFINHSQVLSDYLNELRREWRT